MGEKRHGKPVAFETVQAAIQGDVDSINQIIAYFQPYINARSRRKFINEFGVAEFVTDEYMKRRVETKLITKILGFKIRV